MGNAADKGKVVVGLVQINNSFSGQNYLPYAIGLLESFVRASAASDRYEFLLPLYKRMPIRQAVEHLLTADVVGFSTYVWNERISLETARRLKERRPEVTILFGGPQVPDHAEAFLRANPFIDIAVHNEGEQTFRDLLEAFPAIDPAAINGISCIDADGRYLRTAPQPRIRDLSIVPSPFLSGAFDRLMTAHPEETWIGLWETNRGCPFQCTFCDWGSATAAKVNQFDLDRLLAEADWFSDHRIEYIFCCDANFGILKRDVDIARYVADKKRATGYPKALSVQNTKNATERAYLAQSVLAEAGLNKGVALSMQSVDPATLKLIKRDNISLKSYLELQKRFTEDGIETYSDLILGLPGESYDSFADGVDMLITSGQHNRIQFNNLSILPNAEMGNPDYQRRHGMRLVETEIINIHGERVQLDDDMPEMQQLVVETASMPAADWRRTRAFCWMAALLHFDKLFQIPFVIAHELTGIGYRQLIEAFSNVDGARFPLVASIRDFFLAEAAKIQQGGAEYVYSEEWLGIYWPADEYAFIQLTAERKIDDFYRESMDVLFDLLARNGLTAPESAIRDAVGLNRALLKDPFATGDLVITAGWTIMDLHKAVLRGEFSALSEAQTTVHIDRSTERWEDFNDWCRRVVWWGNKKGAYLYSATVTEGHLAGHH